MAIDPSIALQASQQPNILGTLGQALQLKQLQDQRLSNRAVSQAYKENTGADGVINYAALTAALANGPAAYNIPQIQAQINEARNSQLNYDKNKLELAQKRTDLLSGGFGGLLASGNITPQAVMQIASQGIRQGLFSPQDAVNFTSDMPSDPSQLQNWAKQKYVGFSQDSDRLKLLMPQTQTINTGGQQVVSAFDPLTGAPTGQNAVYNNTMSPDAASRPTQIFDPATGTMRNVTREQFAQMSAPGGGGQMGIPMDQAGGAPGGLGTGRMQAPGMVSAPGVAAGPALGATQAAEVIGKGAAQASLALQSAADAAPQSIYQLQNMRTALSDINTGPNADWRGQAQALVLGIAPEIAQKVGIDPQKVASQEEFKKFSVQLAQATSQGLGEGTDSKLASAVAANPNISLSKLGNQQIIDVLIATQRATQAKNSAWQASGLPPEQFNKFSTQWNKEIDPRVFAAQDMDNEHVWKMVDSLPKRDQEAFMKSWAKAQAAGYVQ